MESSLLMKGLAYAIRPMPTKAAPEEEDFRYIPISGLTQTVAVYTDPVRPITPVISRYLELLQEEIRKDL